VSRYRFGRRLSHKPRALARRTTAPVAARNTSPDGVPLTISTRSASVEFVGLYPRNSTLEVRSGLGPSSVTDTRLVGALENPPMSERKRGFVRQPRMMGAARGLREMYPYYGETRYFLVPKTTPRDGGSGRWLA
jgi:hypothetical protein